MAYGMMCVEPGIDLLCVGEMGIANTTSASAIAAAMFGGTGADWAGPGTGIKGAQLTRKAEVIDQALARHRASVQRRARDHALPRRARAGGDRRRGDGGAHGAGAGAARRLRQHGRRQRPAEVCIPARSTIAWWRIARRNRAIAGC